MLWAADGSVVTALARWTGEGRELGSQQMPFGFMFGSHLTADINFIGKVFVNEAASNALPSFIGPMDKTQSIRLCSPVLYL